VEAVSATHIIQVRLGLKLVSEANARDHWRKRHKRAKFQREVARLTLGGDVYGPPPPYVITITRIGPRRLDSDNLAGSAKAVRDGVADWLKVDDGDERLTWVYEQRSEGAGVYACYVSIASTVEPA
jgi:hypothetical protein